MNDLELTLALLNFELVLNKDVSETYYIIEYYSEYFLNETDEATYFFYQTLPFALF